MKKDSKDKQVNLLLQAFWDNESRLRSYLQRFSSSRHDIDDICQETIMRSLEAVKSRKVQEPGPFLFGVARNIVRKQFERQSRALIDFVSDFTPDDYAEDAVNLDDRMDEQQRLILYGEAISRLPPQCQKVFVMKKVYGYSHKEISSELNISVSTVEKHVATGLKRCSEELTERIKTKSENESIIKFPNRLGPARS